MRTIKISSILAIVICLSVGISTPQAVTRISIGTGGTGGVYYPIGGGVAEVFNKHLEGVSARAEVSGASIENCRLVGANEQQMALANVQKASGHPVHVHDVPEQHAAGVPEECTDQLHQ